jgi:hypothetical protein
MKRLPITAVIVITLAAPSVLAFTTLHARLSGYDETPMAISTGASGEFTAKIRDNTIEYEVSYANLEGDVLMSHIHFGKPGVSGGIAVWLCGTTGNFAGPAGTPSCAGVRTGGASGIITPDKVVGPAGQGISAGEFDEVIAAIREGAAYVNVHSTFVQSGEIRGQIK